MTIQPNCALYFVPTTDSNVAAFLPQSRHVPQNLDFKAPAAIEVDDYLLAIAQCAGATLYRASTVFAYLPHGMKGLTALRALKFTTALSLIAKATGAELRVVHCSELSAVHETEWLASVPDDVGISFAANDGLDILDLAPVNATTLIAVHQAARRIGAEYGLDVIREHDPRAWRNRHGSISRLIGAAMLRTMRAA